MADAKETIVIIGGGVIGCCTAYYLTRHPSYDPTRHSITLIEATRLASGASGKAGGLLAQWAYPASLVPLSFDLHRELAADHDGATAWGYRPIRCGKLTAHDRSLPNPADARGDDKPAGGLAAWAVRQLNAWNPLGKQREVQKVEKYLAPVENLPEDLDWFRKECVTKYEDIAPAAASETAQVNPYQFTNAMARLAEERGVKILVNSPVEELIYDDDDDDNDDNSMGSGATPHGGAGRIRRVKAVSYVDKATAQAVTIPATTIILAAGPWTPVLFPMLPMSAIRAHSVTIRPRRPLAAYCLFTELTVPHNPDPSPDERRDPDPARQQQQRPRQTNGNHHARPAAGTRLISPEVYTRPNNEVYIAGEGDSRAPLPATTDEVEVDRAACQTLVDALSSISDELRDAVVTGRRACYLPTVDLPSGGPLVGPSWVAGLLLATGHSCWGIHNAPATGKLVAEMVFDGRALSADIDALDPQLAV
ncbi:FAD dependent oxidoreductase [Phialemonium atrogriseum]|uniref:FAD dependent oxidoreductase n=1 Tax=Phialemonium atrogriseum TaxID=1093897 RepID=A0AAJ0BXI3_9PEZI|nr:FAD dependent oxidoreductase [Phialemonium atrogriseum]KAK1766310.1 FAD dependent oxidoreductase [Phialemonium atrogriseum]